MRGRSAAPAVGGGGGEAAEGGGGIRVEERQGIGEEVREGLPSGPAPSGPRPRGWLPAEGSFLWSNNRVGCGIVLEPGGLEWCVKSWSHGVRRPGARGTRPALEGGRRFVQPRGGLRGRRRHQGVSGVEPVGSRSRVPGPPLLKDNPPPHGCLGRGWTTTAEGAPLSAPRRPPTCTRRYPSRRLPPQCGVLGGTDGGGVRRQEDACLNPIQA